MTRILKMVFLSLLLTVGLNAGDFLSKATGGVLSDGLVGVKQLNQEQMQQVVGGYNYKFARQPIFDNSGRYGSIKSYAFVVTDTDDDAGTVADKFRLGMRELLVLKARYLNNRWQTYLQVYDIDTYQKQREFMLNYESSKILDDFADQYL